MRVASRLVGSMLLFDRVTPMRLLSILEPFDSPD